MLAGLMRMTRIRKISNGGQRRKDTITATFLSQRCFGYILSFRVSEPLDLYF